MIEEVEWKESEAEVDSAPERQNRPKKMGKSTGKEENSREEAGWGDAIGR